MAAASSVVSTDPKAIAYTGGWHLGWLAGMLGLEHSVLAGADPTTAATYDAAWHAGRLAYMTRSEHSVTEPEPAIAPEPTIAPEPVTAEPAAPAAKPEQKGKQQKGKQQKGKQQKSKQKPPVAGSAAAIAPAGGVVGAGAAGAAATGWARIAGADREKVTALQGASADASAGASAGASAAAAKAGKQKSILDGMSDAALSRHFGHTCNGFRPKGKPRLPACHKRAPSSRHAHEVLLRGVGADPEICMCAPTTRAAANKDLPEGAQPAEEPTYDEPASGAAGAAAAGAQAPRTKAKVNAPKKSLFGYFDPKNDAIPDEAIPEISELPGFGTSLKLARPRTQTGRAPPGADFCACTRCNANAYTGELRVAVLYPCSDKAFAAIADTAVHYPDTDRPYGVMKRLCYCNSKVRLTLIGEKPPTADGVEAYQRLLEGDDRDDNQEHDDHDDDAAEEEQGQPPRPPQPRRRCRGFAPRKGASAAAVAQSNNPFDALSSDAPPADAPPADAPPADAPPADAPPAVDWTDESEDETADVGNDKADKPKDDAQDDAADAGKGGKSEDDAEGWVSN